MQLTLDLPVTFLGDVEGVLGDVVIDPDTSSVAHVVVHQKHHDSQARLIPIADITVNDAEELCCSGAPESYPLVEETEFVRMSESVELEGDWDVGIERVLTRPYYSAEFDELGSMPYGYNDEVGIAYHRIPKGSVEIRRESEVTTADDKRVGHVDGFITDDEGHVTHVVLGEGHLWGHHEISIPMSSVSRVSNDEIWLTLSEAEVDQLPRPKLSRLWHR